MRESKVSVPLSDTRVQMGDTFRAIGPAAAVAHVVAAMGRPSPTSLDRVSGDITANELVVTNARVLRRTLGDLDLPHRLGVSIGWVNRAGTTLVPEPSLKLVFGDRVRVIGDPGGAQVRRGRARELFRPAESCPVDPDLPWNRDWSLGGGIPIWVPGLDARSGSGWRGAP